MIKTNKVIIIVERANKSKYSAVIRLKATQEMPKDNWIIALDRLHKRHFQNETVVDVYDGNYYHVCKYCGNITKGDFEDFLCDDCRELFGHSCYSEL